MEVDLKLNGLENCKNIVHKGEMEVDRKLNSLDISGNHVPEEKMEIDVMSNLGIEKKNIEENIKRLVANNEKLLSIVEFKKEINYETDDELFNFFLEIKESECDLHIGFYGLEKFGYEGEFKKQKSKFLKFLKDNSVPYKDLSYENVKLIDFKTLFGEKENLLNQSAVKRSKFLIMKPEDVLQAILHMNTKIAKTLKNYYYKDFKVLRKLYSSYKMEFKEEETRKKLSKEKEQLETKHRKELAEKDKTIKHQDKANKELRTMFTREREKQPAEWMYIATSEANAQKNIFKIGGVKAYELLKGRLATYNCGRPIGDKFYYSHIVNCYNFKTVELRIKQCVGIFRIESEKEDYYMHYYSAVDVVNFFCESSNKEVDMFKGRFDEFFDLRLNGEPVVPKPLALTGRDGRLLKNSVLAVTQEVDWDLLDSDDQINLVRTVFGDYLLTVSEDKEIQRTEFEKFFVLQQHAKFNKKKLWPVLKAVSKENNRNVKY